MKTTIRLILIAFLMLLYNSSMAATITPVSNNGDWENPSTWDLGRIPEDLDVVMIPTGTTVIVSTNLYHAVPRQPDLTIKVNGILQLTGSGQINIGCGSSICVAVTGSIPATGCNCNQINIGAGGAEWKGMHGSTLAGECIEGDCVLPVTLIDFSGHVVNNQVQLSWSSSEEINFDRYIVERSSDGISFQETGSIEGNVGTGSGYSYNEEKILQGLCYYRLKMLDKDQSYSYSKVISVKGLPTSINIYPNPVNHGEAIRLTFSDEQLESDLSVWIKDLSGKEFKRINYSTGELSGTDTDLLIDLPSGLYILVISGTHYFASSSLVVK